MHIFSLSAHLWPPYAHMHIFPFSLTVDKTPGRERDKRHKERGRERERAASISNEFYIAFLLGEDVEKRSLWCGFAPPGGRHRRPLLSK